MSFTSTRAPRAPRRTSRLVGLLLATLALGLTQACGGDTETAAPAGAVRTVEDAEGTSVEVPEKPLRVVTLSEPTLDGALALGVEPVGTVAGRGQSGAPGYLGEVAADIPVLGTVSNLDYEKIAAADPDLILVDGTSVNSAEVMSVLRRTAPTFYAGYAGGDWRVTFENVARALNREDEGKEVVASYEADVAKVAKELTQYAGQTFSVVRWQGGSASLILKELPAGMALDDLGLARPTGQDRRGRGHSEPVSLENLASIDADHMFFGTLGGSSTNNPSAGGASDVDGARKALAEAEKVPGFTSLDAYRNDNVHLVDGSLWTSTGGPLLMRGLVESVEEALR